jgi:alpha-galactosidase
MGWNSWNGLGCQGLNQGVVTQTAELIVSLGLKDAGYKYINLDDCWMAPNRTINGTFQADSRRFPSGMKKLGDYIHSKGLLFGIYSSAGMYRNAMKWLCVWKS